MPVLLEICFPGKARPQTVSPAAIESDAVDTVESLHKIAGLPLVAPEPDNHEASVTRLIDLVLGDEAGDLRAWLRQNWAPGLDVRDAYIQADRALPSKQSWSGWLKFGVVTGVSAVIGALIADPMTGLLAGTAIGPADRQFGGKAVEGLADPYHPSHWLSYLGKR